MRLLLADDHTLFRDALVQYIERAEPDAYTILARDLHEVMDIMEGAPVLDLVLLDFRMPGMNGLEGLSKITTTYPEVSVALLSGLAEQTDVEEAMAMGARGYFPKTMSGKAMLNGIHKIMDGEIFLPIDHNTNQIMASYSRISDNFAPRVIGGARDKKIPPQKLTPRENDVLQYLMRGAPNKEIARALDLQVVTVKLHVRGICRKLGAKNRTQAALIAQEKNMNNKNS